MKEKELFKKILSQNGELYQIDKLIEEMAELTKALVRYKMNKSHNVEEKIIDVTITLEQIKLLFKKECLDKWFDVKIHKLNEMIKKGD